MDSNIDLKKIIDKHRLWLLDDEEGERANLSRANLSGANLYGADKEKTYFPVISKWAVLLKGPDMIKIGCKEKTMSEWDEWFVGTKEYTTKRGTEEFRMIHAAYLGMRAYGIAMGILKEATHD